MGSSSKKKKIIIIVSVVALILILVSILGFKIWKDKQRIQPQVENTGDTQAEEKKEEKKENKKINIYKGDDRVIAVMIDNHKGAWPQAGLNSTYAVYEIVVEGGETRLMALFKGADLETIGPVRSSRHYFLDYAMENDAIYTHYGWSPQAKNDISKFGVNNLNGIYYSKPTFWRVSTKRSPHNAMTSTKQILKAANKKGYRTDSKETSVLNYVSEEVNLKNGIKAETVKIPHSYLQSVKYVYNAKTKRYTRYARGILQKDYTTGKEITTKNIIIQYSNNADLNDGSTKGRQTLNNIGTFNGYYITNGKAIKISCIKSSRESKTIYKDEKGKIINVNDGNTWFNICPKNAKVVIE